APEPLVPLGVLSNPIVIFAILANSMGSGATIVLNVFVPLFLQLLLGLSASRSGLLLMTLMFSFNVGAGISGQVTARVRRYKVMPIVGASLALAATITLGFVANRSGLIAIEVLLTIIGLGVGTVPPVATVSLQNAVEWDQLGAATASLNFVRSLAGTTFVGVFGAILAAKLGPEILQGTASAGAIGERAALADTFQFIFFGTSAGFALALLALWRLEERPLRTSRPAARPRSICSPPSRNCSSNELAPFDDPPRSASTSGSPTTNGVSSVRVSCCSRLAVLTMSPMTVKAMLCALPTSPSTAGP